MSTILEFLYAFFVFPIILFAFIAAAFAFGALYVLFWLWIWLRIYNFFTGKNLKIMEDIL